MTFTTSVIGSGMLFGTRLLPKKEDVNIKVLACRLEYNMAYKTYSQSHLLVDLQGALACEGPSRPEEIVVAS
jgi:hypothetical protein